MVPLVAVPRWLLCGHVCRAWRDQWDRWLAGPDDVVTSLPRLLWCRARAAPFGESTLARAVGRVSTAELLVEVTTVPGYWRQAAAVAAKLGRHELVAGCARYAPLPVGVRAAAARAGHTIPGIGTAGPDPAAPTETTVVALRCAAVRLEYTSPRWIVSVEPADTQVFLGERTAPLPVLFAPSSPRCRRPPDLVYCRRARDDVDRIVVTSVAAADIDRYSTVVVGDHVYTPLTHGDIDTMLALER